MICNVGGSDCHTKMLNYICVEINLSMCDSVTAQSSDERVDVLVWRGERGEERGGKSGTIFHRASHYS